MTSQPTTPAPPFTFGTAPGALPVLGHSRQLVKDPFAFMKSLPALGDLVEIRLGPQRAFVPCHPELLRQVLADDHTFDRGGPLYDKMREFMGNGLATCPHALHRRQRRMIQPVFQPERLERYAAIMESELPALLRTWSDGHVIDAFPEFYRYTQRVVARALFEANVDQATVDVLQRCFTVAFANIFARIMAPPVLQKLPTPGNRRFRKAITDLDTTFEGILRDYRRTDSDRDDLLSLLLTAQDEEGAGASPTEVRDQVVSLLMGGAETVAATLAWACWLLARHPEVLRRLYAEADAVLDGRPARWSDLPDLRYTERVVTEVLRMYPAGWLLTRTTTRETELAGRRLPVGSTVLFSSYILHHRPDIFTEPETFDPDRWLPERAATLPRGGFAAFGHGPHKCIGDAFGMTESILTLATIAARWTWEVAPGADMRPAPMAAVLNPRHLPLRLKERHPAAPAHERPATSRETSR
ncbi:cytochrome P450 [Streptomyces celluloflavus]|uniref:cytochrome P450 n=1 Tax=Streptomyces celluloflavus TaxID=58344 RepID=UPI00368A5920